MWVARGGSRTCRSGATDPKWRRSRVITVVGAESLRERYRGRVSPAERKVGVPLHEVGDPFQVLRCRCLDIEGHETAEEFGFSRRAEASTDEAGRLGARESRDHEPEITAGEGVDGPLVVDVVGVSGSGPASTTASTRVPLPSAQLLHVACGGQFAAPHDCGERQLAVILSCPKAEVIGQRVSRDGGHRDGAPASLAIECLGELIRKRDGSCDAYVHTGIAGVDRGPNRAVTPRALRDPGRRRTRAPIRATAPSARTAVHASDSVGRTRKPATCRSASITTLPIPSARSRATGMSTAV